MICGFDLVMVCCAMLVVLHCFMDDDFDGIDSPVLLVPGGTRARRYAFRAVRFITVLLGSVTTVVIR